MAISNLSDLANRLTGGSSGNPQHAWFYFENRVGAASAAQTVANRIRTLWLQNKTNGAAASNAGSTTMVACSSATIGALPITARGASDTPAGTYMLGMDVAAGATSAGIYMVYDRLLHNSSMVHNVATEQTVLNSSAEVVPVPRYNSTVSTDWNFARCNQIWLEVQAGGLGSTMVNTTIKYTNELGATGHVTPICRTFPSTVVGTIVPVSLAAGDRGVLGVQSLTHATSQAGGACFGIVVARPLATVPVPLSGWGMSRDFLAGMPALPRISSGACLTFTAQFLGAGDPSGVIACHFVDA